MKKIIFLLLTLLLTSCSAPTQSEPINPEGDDIIDEPPVDDDPPIEEDPPVEEEDKHLDDIIDKDMPKGQALFDAFFTYGNNITIELDFTNEAIIKLADYGRTWGNNDNFVKNEMYHPCNMKVTINGVTNTYYEVGARMRGNTSRNPNFIDSRGYFVDGEYVHFKLNFAQTFDNKDDNDYYINKWIDEDKKEDREDRKFATMKKLDLKWNRNYDNTFTKELYALDAYRNEGVLAQHANLVTLIINTEVDSRTLLYTAYEPVDKQLLKKAYPSDYSGDLYKCLWQTTKADLTNYDNGIVGVEKTGYKPTYGLKTNESKSNMQNIKTFIDNVNLTMKYDNYTGDMYYENISNYMDVDNFLKYSALCWVMGLPDDLRNNANNYYIYFNKNNKALFLPYDNDRCLGIEYGWQKDLSSQTYDDPYAKGYDEFNKCPLILRLITGGSNNTHPVHQDSKDKYYAYCVEFANKYLDIDRFEDFTYQFKDIDNAPSMDITDGGPSNQSFYEYGYAKLQTLDLI